MSPCVPFTSLDWSCSVPRCLALATSGMGHSSHSFPGLAMFLIDTWANPAQLRETAGFGIIVKLLLVGLMVLFPAQAEPVFWLILVLSTLISHAPGPFRHRRLF